VEVVSPYSWSIVQLIDGTVKLVQDKFCWKEILHAVLQSDSSNGVS